MSEQAIARRDFLRLSSLVGAAHGMGLAGLSRLDAAPAAAAQDEWIPTCCNMCGGTTGVWAHVVDGRVVKIEPNSENPIGISNIYNDFVRLKSTGARMCPKGNAAIMSLYDPDRLQTPLKRTGARGAGQWQVIDYDVAVAEIAARLKALRRPEELLWFSEDNSFIAIQQSFCNLYGTPNFMQHSNLCDAARNVGFSKVLGHGRPLPDLRNTRYMLIFGWNPLGAMKWAHLPRILLDGLANGARLVIVDPRCCETAEKALDYRGRWIPIRPGTDGALALAMANVIIGEKLYDASFVAQWTVGFDAFAALVKNRPPAWAENITGIPASTITTLARELAAAKPAVIDVWSGPGHHTNGTNGTRAIAALAALLGQIDKPGTLVLPERKGPKFTVPALAAANPPERIDGKGTTYPFASGSGVYVAARDAMISGKPYPPKAAFFMFQNFVFSVPNTARNLEALNRLDLIVAVDTHLSETALMADYVIPGSNFLERYELLPQWVTFPVVALRQPVVAPLFGQRVEYEFVQDLAHQMGYGSKYPFSVDYTTYMDDALKAGIGIGLEKLRSLPGATWIGGETHYQKHESGLLRKDLNPGFETPSGKYEFSSAEMAEKGLAALPDYTPPGDQPTAAYPFYLINWKEALHTHSRTMNNRWLMEFHGENELWMNLDKGRQLGIADGDRVTVENEHARAQAKVRLTARIHPDVVGMVHGFGHWGLGPVAQGKGINDSQFVPGKFDTISGMAAHKEAAVRIYK